MIGKFLNGALVGGVMAAAGLATASLISPHRAPLSQPADLGDDEAVAPDAQVSESTETAVATPVAETADTSLAAEPDGAAKEPAKVPVAADQPAPDPTPPAVEGDDTPEVPKPVPASAETADAPTAKSDAVAQLASDVLAKLDPADAPAAASEPAPKAVDQTPATVSNAPDVPAPGSEEATPQTPALAVVEVPEVPGGPAKPAKPDQDVVIAQVDSPTPLPAPAEETVVADAGNADSPALPEISEPEPITPTPEPELAPAPAPEEPAPDAQVMPAPEVPELPGTEAPAMPGKKPRSLPDQTAEPDPAAPETEVAVLPEPDEAPSKTFKPTPGFAGKTEGVIVGRLPKVGAEPAPEVVQEDVQPDAGPLQQFARSFENPDNKPAFAIVLIDTGEADLDRQMLANLPFPATFAIDPLAPDAADRAAVYRSAGQEVIMLATGIAEGATASDIEVAFQSMAQGLPESVAVMDGADLRFQGNRPLASLVVPVIAAQGRGLLTWDQGLNAADQVARRVDLAAAVVFRNLDSADEDRVAIRRYLDRAAFKAGQDGRVTVVGQTRPETVAALLEWTVEGRAANVALAPVSAVLTVE